MTLFSIKRHQDHRAVSGKDIPLWIKLSYTAMAIVVLAVYWDYMGPANYLWFSDIALILLVPALWCGSRLLASTMAIAVLVPELVWVLDFFTLNYFTDLTSYMFDDELALHIRVLSGIFHAALPLVIIYMLYQFGYDPRALPLQTLLAFVVLPLSYLVSDPEANINWAYGLGEPQERLNPWLYLILLWGATVVLLYMPTHLFLKRFFNQGRLTQQRSP